MIQWGAFQKINTHTTDNTIYVDYYGSFFIMSIHWRAIYWGRHTLPYLRGWTTPLLHVRYLILDFRLQVQNFWSSETRLPGPTLDRLVAMLEAMYSPVTEQQYLSYATNLLLEMTSKSPDYQRDIFELPLSECKFSVSLSVSGFIIIPAKGVLYRICPTNILLLVEGWPWLTRGPQ